MESGAVARIVFQEFVPSLFPKSVALPERAIKETDVESSATKSRKAVYAGSPLSGHWLRGVDLNHRPLGYEGKSFWLCWFGISGPQGGEPEEKFFLLSRAAIRD